MVAGSDVSLAGQLVGERGKPSRDVRGIGVRVAGGEADVADAGVGQRRRDVFGGVAVLAEDEGFLAGVLGGEHVDQGVHLGVPGGVPVPEPVEQFGDGVVVVGQVLAQGGLEYGRVDPLGLGRQGLHQRGVTGRDAAVEIPVAFDVLVGYGDLLVAEGAERDGQLVVDRVNEQFVAGALTLQGQDERVSGGGQALEETDPDEAADVAAAGADVVKVLGVDGGVVGAWVVVVGETVARQDQVADGVEG